MAMLCTFQLLGFYCDVMTERQATNEARARSNAARLDDESVRRAYARWAPLYDRSFASFLEAGRRQATAAVNEHGGRLLEVGVGTGISLPDYGSQFEISGIDLSPDMLDKARERVREAGLKNVRGLYEMDASDLKFEAESFDVAAAMYVMTVVPDPQAVMRELERVVAPGGQIFIVNHFAVPDGVRGLAERLLAPASRFLGWRPDLQAEAITDAAVSTRLVEVRALKPFGLWTLLRFEKPL